MPLILVVEPEARFVERIRDALAPEGWSIRVVTGRDDALSTASSLSPSLVMVSAKADGAPELLNTFARKRGGPGVIVLIPEAPTLEQAALEAHADITLEKPFTDAEIRRALRTAMRARTEDQAPVGTSPSAESLLTSKDIFGDLLDDVADEPEDEPGLQVDPSEIYEGAITPPPEVVSPAPSAPSPAIEPEPTTVQPEAPAASERAPRSGAGPGDEEVERRLEKSLAGLIDVPSEAAKKARSAPTRLDRRLEESLAGLIDEDLVSRSKPTAAPAGDDEIDHLLNETLMGLDLPRRAGAGKTKKRPTTPQPGPPSAAPAAPQPAPSEPPPERAAATETAAADSEPHRPEGGVSEETAPERLPSEASAAQDEPAQSFRPFTGPDQAFGQYSLLERIAVGGMAEVWKARMEGVEGFQKTVAIKKILPHLTGNSGFVNMFIDEAKLAAQLNHPNITHIYDLGKIEDDYYIAMEYVEGKNLRSILSATRQRGSRLPLELSLLIAARLAGGLDYAHRKKGFDGSELGLVHRDVSPQNVLISFEGDIKLCDFGIVKAVSKTSHTQLGALKGKLQYMSPEQAWGRPVDARSDLFSLGALLFEMLTGHRLFAGDTEMSVLEKVRQGEIPNPASLEPNIPQEVDRLVMRALARDPDDRFQTAAEMRKELETLLHDLESAPRQADLAAFMHWLQTQAAQTDDDEPSSLSVRPAIPEPTDQGTPGASDRAADPSAAAEAAALLDSIERPRGEPAGAAAGDAEKEGEGEEVDDRAAAEAVEALRSEEDRADEASDQAVDEVPRETSADEDGAATGAEPEAAAVPVTDDETPAFAAAAERADEADKTDEVEVVPPTGDDALEPEEGGSKGRGRLIAAIVALVVIGAVVAFVLWQRSRSAADADADAVAPTIEVPATTEGAEGPTGEGDADGADSAGADAASEGASGGSLATPPTTAEGAGAAAAGDDVEEQLDEALADREEQLRQQLEEEQQRLREQVARAQAEAEKKRLEEEEQRKAEEAAELAAQQEAERKAEEERQRLAREEAARKAEQERQRQARLEAERQAEEERKRLEAESKPKRGDLAVIGQPGLNPPALKSIKNPTYPPLARRLRVQGEVELEALVDENGRVTDVRITKAHPQNVGLNEAAVEAARSARFEPATLEGVAVKVWTKLRIPFKL